MSDTTIGKTIIDRLSKSNCTLASLNDGRGFRSTNQTLLTRQQMLSSV
jgi:hypothetical protein